MSALLRLPRVIERTGLSRTVIYDPELSASLPIGASETSGINAIAHAAEWLNSPDATPITDLMAVEGIAALGRALPALHATPIAAGTRADALYGAIDASDYYSNPVAPNARSWMNVPFLIADPALDKTFVAEAAAAGLANLAGHRSVGGMRASIYNAMPIEGVQALIDFMADFEKRNG